MLGPVAGSGYRRPPSLVRRADGQTIQLTPVLYQVLEALDGTRGYDEIASDVSDRISRHAAADDIRYLVERKLRPLGVLRQADGSQPAVKRVNPLLALRLRKVISNPQLTRRITAPFAKLFVPPVVVPVLLAFAAATAWLLFDKGLASATRQALYQPGMLLLVFALTILSAGFHEFGHAAAARYAGATPGAMGFGIYLVWPVFYTDVTDAYRLGRGGRLRVDLGGLYFNAIFAVATVGVWAATRWDALLLLVPIQILHMLHQLVPFVRFDGYHILADLTGVPDLFSHIKPTLRRLLPTRWGKREPRVLRPWAGTIVTLWVLTVVPVLALVFVMMVKVLPRLAATAWDSVGVRWEVLQSNWADGSFAEVAVVLLSIAALALPILGISYLVGRVVRRTSLRVWRATADRPALRMLALLAAIAVLGLLAWAWWPNGQYRPVEASERGTLIETGPSTPAMPNVTWVETALARPMAAPPGATPRLALVLSPQGVPVTEPGPKQIVVLPPPGENPGEWVFPFDPPAPPGEGDNQALAVNTEDGSTVYDVAIVLVWVTDGQVDQVNEAWAVASCSSCETVAVAFQGVFSLGEADIVTPQNIAVAVNYNCQQCQTTAIAVQLIATLTSPPSDEAMAQLTKVWDDLEALEENIDELSLTELYAELVGIQAAILDILVDDGALVMSEGAMAEATISDVASTSPDGSAAEESAGTEGAAEGTTTTTDDTTTTTEGGDAETGSSEPPPAPSEPSPTPSDEPSPTSEPSPTPTSGQ
jgi:putative peptide zinc metalloprotease protein